jgi:hypothetical protein
MIGKLSSGDKLSFSRFVNAKSQTGASAAFYEAVAIGWFVLWALIMMGPVVWHLGEYQYGDEGDNVAQTYSRWVSRQAYVSDVGDVVRTRDNYQYYPLGGSYVAQGDRPTLSIGELVRSLAVPHNFLATLLLPWLSEVVIHNLQSFLYLLLSGASMYWLVRRITGNRLAGLIFGSIFAWSPAHLAHMWLHHHFGEVHWIVLFFLALYVYLDTLSLLNAVLSGLVLGFTASSNPYYGLFVIESLVIFAIILLVYHVVLKDWRAIGKMAAHFAVLVLILAGMLFTVYRSFLNQVFDREAVREQIDYVAALRDPIEANLYTVRQPLQLYQYAALPLDFILPAASHPLLGGIRTHIYQYLTDLHVTFEGKSRFSNLHPSWPTWLADVPEGRQYYLGITNLVLAACGLWFWRKKAGLSRAYDVFVLYLAAMILAIPWLALPPQFPLGSYLAAMTGLDPTLLDRLVIVQPNYWFYDLIPQFRVYARFGVLGPLCAIVLAGIGFNGLWTRFQQPWQRAALAGGVLALGLFEYASTPFFHYVDLSQVLPEYEYIMHRPGDFAVFDPRKPLDQQRHHHHPYLDTSLWNALAASSFDIRPILNDLNVRYLIIPRNNDTYSDVLEENDLPLVLTTDEVNVYRVEQTADRQPVVVYGWIESGYVESWEKDTWISGSSWEWTPADDTFYVITTVEDSDLCWQGDILNNQGSLPMEATIVSGLAEDSPSDQPSVAISQHDGEIGLELGLQPGVYAITLRGKEEAPLPDGFVITDIKFDECGG